MEKGSKTHANMSLKSFEKKIGSGKHSDAKLTFMKNVPTHILLIQFIVCGPGSYFMYCFVKSCFTFPFLSYLLI